MMIRTLKLISGEELVCEVLSGLDEDEAVLRIKNPIKLYSVNGGIATADWLSSVDLKNKVVSLEKRNLLTDPMEPGDEVSEHYYLKFAKIAVPNMQVGLS